MTDCQNLMIISIIPSRLCDEACPIWWGFPQMRLLRTFNLLLVPEPAQVGGRLAPLGGAGQGDVVSLQGRIHQAIYLRLLWHTWGVEHKHTHAGRIVIGSDQTFSCGNDATVAGPHQRIPAWADGVMAAGPVPFKDQLTQMKAISSCW